MTFLLENKGQIENRCHTLAYEIVSIEERGHKKLGNFKPVFRHRSGNIVPTEAEYYYVRAGVTMRVTKRHWIPANVSAVRVKAFILYLGERREIDENKDIFPEMYAFDDWTAIDRVLNVTATPSHEGRGTGRQT